MNGHNVARHEEAGVHWGECPCGVDSPTLHFKWQLDDWVRDHHAEMTTNRIHRKSVPRPKLAPQEDDLPLF